jgi:hypothetical protein
MYFWGDVSGLYVCHEICLRYRENGIAVREDARTFKATRKHGCDDVEAVGFICGWDM